MKNQSRITRRTLLKQAVAAGVGAAALPLIVPSHLFGADAPSNKLNIAMLACGGRARDDLGAYVSRENVVAICDVDQRQVAEAKKILARHGQADKAKVYEDYRKLLDEEKSVDAVVIAPGQRWHVPMSKRAMQAGKHVFCEKPLAHSCAQAREIRELALQHPKLATQVGSQGGATDTFRRSMEVIQAGVLGAIREVHVWMDRGCDPSRNYDTKADRIPPELNWDFWCGPSKVLPFKNHYLGFCLNWGPWLEFADGHLADMGAHGLNLPWRALKLTTALNCKVRVPEPVKDSYPSATDICWEFAARGDMPAVQLWWHDGNQGVTRSCRSTWFRSWCPRTERFRATACCSSVRRAFSAPTAGAWAGLSSSRVKNFSAACWTIRVARECPSLCPGLLIRTTWANGSPLARGVPGRSRVLKPEPWSPRSPWWAWSPSAFGRA